VLEAAGTKWNFLPFRPGLVGGHCIGVDPYYLTFKAQSFGYYPEVILAGRRINDGMGKYVAERTVKTLIRAGKQIQGTKVAILGLTFKEDVPDIRNTKVMDIVRELRDYGIAVRIHDPLADKKEALSHYNLEIQELDELAGSDAVIVAVNHSYYKNLGLSSIARLCRNGLPIIVDVKGMFNPIEAKEKGIEYWCL
jgi:UDP-N-acetyl-D-galactosamine dehydrogenase